MGRDLLPPALTKCTGKITMPVNVYVIGGVDLETRFIYGQNCIEQRELPALLPIVYWGLKENSISPIDFTISLRVLWLGVRFNGLSMEFVFFKGTFYSGEKLYRIIRKFKYHHLFSLYCVCSSFRVTQLERTDVKGKLWTHIYELKYLYCSLHVFENLWKFQR